MRSQCAFLYPSIYLLNVHQAIFIVYIFLNCEFFLLNFELEVVSTNSQWHIIAKVWRAGSKCAVTNV